MKEKIEHAAGRLAMAQQVFSDAHTEMLEANTILKDVIDEAQSHLLSAKTQLKKNNRFVKAIKKFI